MERQAAFADGEWENELARSILILYGSAMGCGKEIAGQENDFAVDNDAVKALGSKVTQDEIDAGKQREAQSRERREKKKKRPKRLRKPPWESPPDSVVEFEKSQASKAASSKPSISADPNAKPLRPVWYLGTGPVQSEWDCLPEGDDMRLDLQALDEAGKYVEYLSCVEASLNAYVRRRCDGEGEQGRLFGRLWRQLCVTACVFVSRAVDQRRPALAMKLLDRAKQYSVSSAAHVQVKADARELQAFVEDAYAYYYYCRGKYHAALHCVVKAMKIHVKQEEHAHVAKCHVHSACILSRLRRRPEAVRCLGQVLFLVESEKLDMCGDQPHLICLVAIAHHNMAVVHCVEINQCVGCTRQFFTKSFLSDGAAVLAPIEQASRRWRGGRGDDSTRTLRKILISTQVEQQGLGHFEEAVVSAQNARRLARLCLSYSNRWLEAFENTHRTCAESLTLRGNQISGAPRHRRDIGSVAASARWRGVSRPSTRRCPRDRVGSMAWMFTKVHAL